MENILPIRQHGQIITEYKTTRKFVRGAFQVWWNTFLILTCILFTAVCKTLTTIRQSIFCKRLVMLLPENKLINVPNQILKTLLVHWGQEYMLHNSRATLVPNTCAIRDSYFSLAGRYRKRWLIEALLNRIYWITNTYLKVLGHEKQRSMKYKTRYECLW